MGIKFEKEKTDFAASVVIDLLKKVLRKEIDLPTESKSVNEFVSNYLGTSKIRKETLGAKIRNRLSPYSNLIEMANDEIFKEDLKEELKNPVHRQCLNELIEISKECEIEPSDELVNKLDNED